MPIIISPQYNNPGMGQIAANLTQAIFGDPEARSKRDLMAAQSQYALAHADDARARAQRGWIANAAAQRMGANMTGLRRAPGEGDDAYYSHADAALGDILASDPNSSVDQILRGRGYALGQDAILSPMRDRRFQGIELMGGIPNKDTAVDPGMVTERQNAELTEKKAVADINLRGTKYTADQNLAGKKYDVDHPNPLSASNIFTVEDGKEGIPLPGSPWEAAAGGPGKRLKYSGPAKAGKEMAVDPSKEQELESLAWGLIPGAFTPNEDGTKKIPDKDLFYTISPADRIEAKRRMDEAYRSSGGNPSAGTAAYLDYLGIKPGSKYIPRNSTDSLAGDQRGKAGGPAAYIQNPDGSEYKWPSRKKPAQAAAAAVATPTPVVAAAVPGAGPVAAPDAAAPSVTQAAVASAPAIAAKSPAEAAADAAVRKPANAPGDLSSISLPDEMPVSSLADLFAPQPQATPLADEVQQTSAPAAPPPADQGGPVAKVFERNPSKASAVPFVESPDQLPAKEDRYDGQIITVPRGNKRVPMRYNASTGRWTPVENKRGRR